MTFAKTPIADRFWPKVDKAPGYGPDGFCWQWIATKESSGYGVISEMRNRRKVNIPAHRWSYEALVEQIPPALEIDHLCRNRACVNPAHLEPVTGRVNRNRGTASLKTREYFAALTTCRRGHPKTEEHGRVTAKGYRECLTCWKMKNVESKLRTRDQRLARRRAAWHAAKAVPS